MIKKSGFKQVWESMSSSADSHIVIGQNDVAVLKALADYYVLSVPLVKRICFPTHKNTRGTRNRMRRLFQHGYVQKTKVEVSFGRGNSGPIYFPSRKGNRALASWYDDAQYLAVNTHRPRSDYLYHWLAVGETHITIQESIAQQENVSVSGWINEWEVVDKNADEQHRYFLQTQLRKNPPLSCSPDAAFLLTVGEHKKVFYLEQDRATTDPKQVAASKVKGYAELYRQQAHRKHFPTATLDRFTVLLITMDAFQRKQIAQAVAAHADQEPELWLFVDRNDFRAETFLHEPITYNCQGEVGPLVKRP